MKEKRELQQEKEREKIDKLERALEEKVKVKQERTLVTPLVDNNGYFIEIKYGRIEIALSNYGFSPAASNE